MFAYTEFYRIDSHSLSENRKRRKVTVDSVVKLGRETTERRRREIITTSLLERRGKNSVETYVIILSAASAIYKPYVQT